MDTWLRVLIPQGYTFNASCAAEFPRHSTRQDALVRADQRLARIITVRSGDAGEGWLCPMSSYPHDS